MDKLVRVLPKSNLNITDIIDLAYALKTRKGLTILLGQG